MIRFCRAILRRFEERPTYTVRQYSSAEYLRRRAAGADLVRVEVPRGGLVIKNAGER